MSPSVFSCLQTEDDISLNLEKSEDRQHRAYNRKQSCNIIVVVIPLHSLLQTVHELFRAHWKVTSPLTGIT